MTVTRVDTNIAGQGIPLRRLAQRPARPPRLIIPGPQISGAPQDGRSLSKREAARPPRAFRKVQKRTFRKNRGKRSVKPSKSYPMRQLCFKWRVTKRPQKRE